MIGADLAYMGTRFITTKECQSPEAYKTMIVQAAASDIMLTDAITGVNANFIKQSLSQPVMIPTTYLHMVRSISTKSWQKRLTPARTAQAVARSMVSWPWCWVNI